MNTRYNTLATINVLTFLAQLVVNYLSTSLPLNGKSTGELSDQYPNLFVPMGLTFAIWGVIYLVLAGWVLLQVAGLLSPKWRERAEPGVLKAGWLFTLLNLLNASWIFAWHWEQVGLSVLLTSSMLVTLVALNEKTQNGRIKTNDWEKGLSHTGFGIYQGWLTIAVIANITAFLVHIRWQGFGFPESAWTLLMIAIGAGLAVFIVLSRNMIFHGLAVAWALLGIYLTRREAGDTETLEYFALAAMIAVLAAVALRFERWRTY